MLGQTGSRYFIPSRVYRSLTGPHCIVAALARGDLIFHLYERWFGLLAYKRRLSAAWSTNACWPGPMPSMARHRLELSGAEPEAVEAFSALRSSGMSVL